VTALYILVVTAVAVYVLWRGRRRRSRPILSPSELGEVLGVSRPVSSDTDAPDRQRRLPQPDPET
jgi:hypothetical protein